MQVHTSFLVIFCIMYVVCLLFYAIGRFLFVAMSILLYCFLLLLFSAETRDYYTTCNILFCYYLPMTAFIRSDTADDALFLQILEVNLYITWRNSYFLSNRISRRIWILPYIYRTIFARIVDKFATMVSTMVSTMVFSLLSCPVSCPV